MDVVNHNGPEVDLKGLGVLKGDFMGPESNALASEESELVRTKTSNRIQYEAQVRVIRNQIGNLEEIRGKLGLSQRKVCQLLMVDPSAWTRWQKNEGNPPPIIWRALQWYLIIQEKIPGLTPQYFVGKDPGVLHQQALQKLDQEVLTRQRWTANIAEELERQNDKWIEQNQALHQLQSDLRQEILGLKSSLKLYRILFFSSISLLVLFVVLGRMIYR